MPEEHYWKMARDDARDTVENFINEIVEQLFDSGEASDDLNNDYPDGDSWHNENHVDKSYTLLEAANLLNQLSSVEEDDDGLWEGQSPHDAISTQAAYTYGNAVYSEWSDFIREINDGVGDRADALRRERDGKLEAARASLENPGLSEDARSKIESQIEALEDEDRFEEDVKRKLKREVEISAGIKKQKRTGPKEWSP